MEAPKNKTFAKDSSFLQLLESAPDGLIIVDRGGRIVLANSRIEALFGHSSAALIGQPVEVLIPERLRETHVGHRQAFTQSPQVRAMGHGLQVLGLHANGQEFHVEISLSPLQTEDEQLIIAAVRDISEQRRSDAKFRAMMEAAPDAMLLIDQEGYIQLANSQAEELLGYSRGELLGRSMEILVPQTARQVHPGLRQRYHGQPYVRPMGAGLELYALHKDGRELPVEIGLSPMETDEGMQIIAALRDVSKQKRLHDHLSVLSITDELTGLLNRRGFLEVGGKLRAIAKRTNAQLVLVMVDIDRLKEINDQFGHSAGDQCIQDVAKVLQQSTRESDVIARWGGDEFLVLVLESKPSSPKILADRIKANLDRFNQEQSRDFSLSISVGIAVSEPGKDGSFEELIEAADRRMYLEKKK